MPLSAYGLCEALITTPAEQAQRAREIRDRGRRHRAAQCTSTPAAEKPGFERRLEHVARDARVLADQHRRGRLRPVPASTLPAA